LSEQESTYKKILKSTSIFGLVQLSNLLISVVRHKFFALIVGPAGYGIFSLLYSAFDLVKQGSGFGLEVTGVKKIAESNEKGDKDKVAAILIKLSVLTGIIGTLFLMMLSYNLSSWAFGNGRKTLAIIVISVAIFFRQLFGAQTAVMQGSGKVKFLAKTNLLGNFYSLLFTLPLFYFYKIDAILPSILISAIISFIISSIYYDKMGIAKYSISFKNSLREGKDIIYFGSLMAINGFLPTLSNYLIQLYINSTGGIVHVGLFNVGQLIINSYVGIIFTAMTMEYYPRLVSFNKNNRMEGAAVNQQAIISMLIIVPVIVLFTEFMPFIIKALLSDKFNGAIPMLSWMILAMYFKAVSFCMGYVIIARADSAVFMKTSIVFNVIYMLLCITGYHLGGLEGLGIGFIIYYMLHLIAMYLISRIRYKLSFNREFYKIFYFGLPICIALISVNTYFESQLKHIIFIMLLLACISFSYIEINKKLNIRDLVFKYIAKKRNNGNY
jgi:O-antigen/teichoic acid export membrane protein